MAARHVRPLDPDAWDSFVEALRRGPSEEQVRAIERAMELTRHLAEPGDEDYEGPAGAPPACPPDARRGEEAAGRKGRRA